jgi:formamidopyrimidine-DNA glycosylase
MAMPELPEVETVRRELEPWLSGRRIRTAERCDAPAGPKYANLDRAQGQRIQSVGRRGKFLLLPLSGGDDLVIHLGMTGVIRATKPPGHLRVRLLLGGRGVRTLYFQDVRRFGRFLVVPTGNYQCLPTLANLGPEPLSDAFEPGAFFRSLQARKTNIKSLLLGQRVVAGIGNIYADESLWRAGIHPETLGCRVSRAKAAGLHKAIVEVLKKAILAQGTTLNDYRTVNGSVGGYASELNVYAHEGDPCKRCSSTILRRIVAQRSSHYCPRCQRMPRRSKA